MYAIIEESGGQRKVTQGDEVFIDLYQHGGASIGDKITFDKVLVVGPEGGTAKIGTPYVAGASVSAEVLEPVAKGDKIYIHKFRAKKGYRRKTGHRQRFTRVKITAIAG
ncbi:MAG: 50S ribosomal protein L21 [Phycisphaeraceae bacterium]|nr:50S ribosomal protein L21 [Phycisphaeraceae bacterium]MCW5763004.1 50S ribosomal protein L21 [Phycisphaeraceae bacterium]